MPLVNSISNMIAKLPSSPQFDRLMSKVSNPAPGNAAPYLIPESAVIGGRSAFAWFRNGFIEFQERFLEETVVAALWFWGVTWLDNMYKGAWKKWAPGAMKNLDMDLDWGFAKNRSMEQSSFERYAFNRKEWGKFLKAKSGKLLFAVGGTLFAVAVLIPWLNQVKTDWILKKYYGGKGHGGHGGKPEGTGEKPHNPQPEEFSKQDRSRSLNPHMGPEPSSSFRRLPRQEAPVPLSNALPPTQNPGWISSPPRTHGLAPNQNPAWSLPIGGNALPPHQNPAWTTPNPIPHAPSPYYPTVQGNIPTQPIRFGFAGGNTLQLIGHAIENTDVGRMLVIDSGITGGRAVVAGRRSPFESAEIVFRDAVSLYFYILCVPHVTKLLNKVVNPHLAASILLDPGVADKLTQKIMQDPFLQQSLKQGKLSTKQLDGLLKHLFYGIDPEGRVGKALAKFPIEELQTSMRTARVNAPGGFRDLMAKEFNVLFNRKEGGQYAKQVMAYLGKAETLTANQAMKLVDAIKAGQGPFADISAGARKDMVTGIKQAFGYNVGLSVADFKKAYEPIIRNLGDDAALFTQRLEAMANQDGRDLINKIFRRSINVSRQVLGASDELVREAEFLSRYIEKATGHNLPMGTVLSNEARDILTQLGRKKLTVSKAEQAMLNRFVEAQPLAKGDIALMNGLIEKAKAHRIGMLKSRSPKPLIARLKDLRNVMIEGVSSDVMVRRRVDSILGRIETVLAKNKASVAPDAKVLIQHYRKLLVEGFQGGQPRIFSLAVDTVDKTAPELTRKIKELLHGGLVNDTAFLKEGLRTISALEDSARMFVSESKSAEMTHALKDYMKTLMRNMNANHAERNWGEKGVKEFLGYFHKLSKNSSYITRWVGLLAAMAGLGILVPKFQYIMTKHLTGKDEHPGIAAAKAKAGIGVEPEESSVPAYGYSSALNRNNFSAFKSV